MFDLNVSLTFFFRFLPTKDEMANAYVRLDGRIAQMATLEGIVMLWIFASANRPETIAIMEFCARVTMIGLSAKARA
jgi:hypothetical protein